MSTALTKLKQLELAIYDAGVYGGMATSKAIEDLRAEETRLGVYNPNEPCPRWQDPTYEAQEAVLRAEARATPAGQLLARMGMEYWDAESCARRVAEHAAEEIAEHTAALDLIAAWLDDLSGSNPGYMGKLCLQDYGQMNEAFMALDRCRAKFGKPTT